VLNLMDPCRAAGSLQGRAGEAGGKARRRLSVPWGKRARRGGSLTSVRLRPPSVTLPRRHSHPDCRWPLILIVARQTGQKSAAVPPTRHRIPRPSSSSRNGGRNLSRNGARGPKSRAPVRALAGAPHVAQLGLSQRDTHAIYRHPNPRCQIKSWLLGRRDHLQAGTHETLVPRPH
jgi:hypothetical protein